MSSKTNEQTVNLGVKKFKREQGTRFDGSYNPKKKSLRGSIVRDLKAEAWDVWTKAHKPKVEKLTKAQQHNQKFLEANKLLDEVRRPDEKAL